MEIEHKSKLPFNKRPGVGAYKPDLNKVKARLVGGVMEKTDRVGYLDELEWRSKNSPGHYDKKYHLTSEKVRHAVIMPDNKDKVVINRNNNLVGPGSYDVEDSFISSQKPKPKFFMSKSPVDSFINQSVKQTKKNPGVGQYHVENMHKIVTKGLSKGWK